MSRTVVIATAGHVDHGKSTLVRALTGTDPDRWAEEKRRGLTIDLGYAWTTWDDLTVAWVDVPGHRRFIGNMLAGLGPAPAVMLIVAADEGWSAQTSEHFAAILALRVPPGLVVITKADRGHAETARIQIREHLRGTAWATAKVVAVSAVTGWGLDEVREAVTTLASATAPAPATARVRLWVDRSFTVAGTGTVVTGTLAEGSIRQGDELTMIDGQGVEQSRVTVRGLRVMGVASDVALGPTRVALNVRGLEVSQAPRGAAVYTPHRWHTTTCLDVIVDVPAEDIPRVVTMHVGTLSTTARIRPFHGRAARLTLPHPVPLTSGDVIVLREPGREAALWGATVVDPDPPALRRRGEGTARGEALLTAPVPLPLASDVGRRGWLPLSAARRLGHDPDDVPAPARELAPEQVVCVGDHLSTMATLRTANATVTQRLRERAQRCPEQPTLTTAEVTQALGFPHATALAAALAVREPCEPAVEQARGRLGLAGVRPEAGAAEPGLAWIERRLQEDPFAAPEADDLHQHGVDQRALAVAVATNRLLVIGDAVVLLPSSPAQAMRRLVRVEQPFTLSQARQALQTTRRVAVPLLEHLDARGWTRRVDATHRIVVR